jgi:hypothetical protein
MSQEVQLENFFDFGTVSNFARNYLTTYYVQDPSDDERTILSFLVNHLRNLEPVSAVIEIGCGPTLHHVLPLVPYASEIHMAEYLEDNLEQIRLWKENHPDAHNWNHYTSLVLSLEGRSPTPEKIESREDELRQKIASIQHCDLKSDIPLGEERQYPIVCSFYTAEQISNQKSEWQQVMRRLGNLVAPGGYLFLSSVAEGDYYRIYSQGKTEEIPLTYLTPNDFREILPELGFKTESLVIESHDLKDLSEEGLSKIMLVAAQKY